MITKINRQDGIKAYPELPLRKYNSKEEEYDFFYPRVFTNYILTLPSRSFRGNASLLGKEIALLTKKLGFDSLIFMGDIDIAWRYRTADYKPAAAGLQYLEKNKLGKRFAGALQVYTAELPEFVKHLSWMVRCNTVLAYIHFTDPGQNIIADLCQYGNLHISPKTTDADKKLRTIIAESKFEFLKDGNCNNRFSKSSAIPGRSIIIK